MDLSRLKELNAKIEASENAEATLVQERVEVRKTVSKLAKDGNLDLNASRQKVETEREKLRFLSKDYPIGTLFSATEGDPRMFQALEKILFIENSEFTIKKMDTSTLTIHSKANDKEYLVTKEELREAIQAERWKQTSELTAARKAQEPEPVAPDADLEVPNANTEREELLREKTEIEAWQRDWEETREALLAKIAEKTKEDGMAYKEYEGSFYKIKEGKMFLVPGQKREDNYFVIEKTGNVLPSKQKYNIPADAEHRTWGEMATQAFDFIQNKKIVANVDLKGIVFENLRFVPAKLDEDGNLIERGKIFVPEAANTKVK